MSDEQLPALPEPAEWMPVPPTATLPPSALLLYTAGQMHAYARAAIAQRDEQIAKLKTVMIAAAEEIQRCWDAHCDAGGYGPANLMRRLEEGIPAEYGYTAGRFAELQAKVEALRADAERLDWIESIAGQARGKVELARSILGTGFEVGEWPSMRVTVQAGSLRAAIDAARAEKGGQA